MGMSTQDAAEETGALTEEEKAQFVASNNEIVDIDTGDENPIKEAYKDRKGWQFNKSQGAQSEVDLYKSYDAFVREFLANAETACVKRARIELQRAGYDVPEQRLDVIELAQETGVYDPVIEVEYTKEDEHSLSISDNGIGISLKQWGIVTEIGLSGSHDDGQNSGRFGRGMVSVFKVTDLMQMKTKSIIDGSKHSQAMTVMDPHKPLNSYRDTIGTTFEMTLNDDGRRNLNIATSMNNYAEDLKVPVRFRVYNSDGSTQVDDEYVPSPMEDKYAGNGNPTVVYEDEFFKAVADKSASRKTLLVSMPIERNQNTYGRASWDSPYGFDLRLKREDGPVYYPEDSDRLGQVPGKDFPEEELEPEERTMWEPAASRDSLVQQHDDHMYQHVSEKLNEQYMEMISELFEDVDTPQEILEMDENDRALAFEAIENNTSGYARGESDKDSLESMQENLKENFNLDFDMNQMKFFSKMFRKVSLAPRNRSSSKVSKKGARRNKMPVYEVLRLVGDADVYMGASLTNSRKIDVAWAMDDDNQVVHIGRSINYGKYESTFGWKKLKDIDLYNLDEYDQLSDIDVQEYGKTRGSGSSGQSTLGNNAPDDARDKTLVVRFGLSSKKRRIDVSEIEDKFKDGKPVAGYDGYPITPDLNKLLIYNNHDPDDELSDDAVYGSKSNGIGLTRVPNYVYEYLTDEADVPNVFETPEEMLDGELDFDIECLDGTTRSYEDLTDTDLLYSVNSEHAEYLREKYEDDPDAVERVVRENVDLATNRMDGDDLDLVAIISPQLGKSIHNKAWGMKDDKPVTVYQQNTALPNAIGGYNVDYTRDIVSLSLPDWDENCDECKFISNNTRVDQARMLVDNLKKLHDQGEDPASEE